MKLAVCILRRFDADVSILHVPSMHVHSCTLIFEAVARPRLAAFDLTAFICFSVCICRYWPKHKIIEDPRAMLSQRYIRQHVYAWKVCMFAAVKCHCKSNLFPGPRLLCTQDWTQTIHPVWRTCEAARKATLKSSPFKNIISGIMQLHAYVKMANPTFIVSSLVAWIISCVLKQRTLLFYSSNGHY